MNDPSIGIFLGTIGSQAGGMETYEKALLSELGAIRRSRPLEVFCLQRRGCHLSLPQSESLRYHSVGWPFRPIGVALGINLAMYRTKVDMLHATYVPPLYCPVPMAFTLHSSVTWVHREFFPSDILRRLNWLQEHGIRKAGMILCVSQHVRDFAVEYFKIPADQTMVVPHGVGPEFHPRDRAETAAILKQRYGIRGRYMFFSGKLKENKNIRRVLHSFRTLREKTGDDIQLVVAGRRLWTKGEIDELMNESVQRGETLELGHIPIDDMPLLYCGAEALVFPSLWEGFGLPILEAQSSGIPVITSSLSAMPEVSGGHAIHIDPYNEEELTDAMTRVLADSALRDRLITGGLQNAKRYTWQEAARLTWSGYEKLLGH